VEELTLKGRAWHELSLEPRWGELQSIAWAADGKGFFVTSWLPDSFNLLHVTLAGKVNPSQDRRRKSGDDQSVPLRVSSFFSS
jgi:hypothetical protein